jgi:hypothetical protein
VHAHEETLRFRVTKLGGIDDVAAMLGQESGYAMNNAALVVAGEREDVFWVSHGISGHGRDGIVARTLPHSPKYGIE